MTTLAAPIYTGTLNGKPLRFFRAPYAEPHLPWHVADDLHSWLGMPPELRQHYRRMHRSSDWSRDVRTLATNDGIITIAPHWMAQVLIASVIEFGRTTLATEIAYTEASGDALSALAGNLPPEAFIQFTTSAFSNTHGLKAAGGAA
ncbi:hypothetical protein MKL09_13935 [Methylobacterium sp. J-048]|uniref:hypothetical protein n=1 Tax=Methylobacterium sp. J-048 TaxID=2836635 RepID=UPI001FBC0A55|nr:hypothetical protein [Methylobacterium sp. J-048]MCJ2057653.1 hypothetical protein [Methylobacterium sp. J-048]